VVDGAGTSRPARPGGDWPDRYARRSRIGPDPPYPDLEVFVKVVVDFDECASNAVCMGILPEVFEVRDDGYLYVLNENPPEEYRERLREAVNGCPTGAISIEDD
jgi:ferredoxin